MTSQPGNSKSSGSCTAAIFRLPLELRQQIYAYLLPRETVSHPLPAAGITSVSHRPPSSSLLNIHPQLTAEILNFFYTLSTWKLVFSHAFNFFRIDPSLRKLEASPSLACLRKIELVFFCDAQLLKSYPRLRVDTFCDEIALRAARACDVLRLAVRLRRVEVSWIDTTDTGAWAEKARVLAPLRALGEHAAARDRPLAFVVGTVRGRRDLGRREFAEALREVVGEAFVQDAAVEEDDGGLVKGMPGDFGMVGLNLRRALSRPGSFPGRVSGRSGWRGAPPSMGYLPEERAGAS